MSIVFLIAKGKIQVSLTSLVGEACVLDVPKEHKDNRDYLITVDDITSWEAQNGKLHDDCFVIIRSGQVYMYIYIRLFYTDIATTVQFHL